MKRTALLLIDVQPVFMTSPRMLTVDGDDLTAKCSRLIDRARSSGIPVVYVQHVDPDDLPDDVDDAQVAFHPDVAPRDGESVVGKRFGSGFMDTPLHELLQGEEITHVVACGLSAYGCVNATVLYGRLLGYDVTVVLDAVAAPELERFPPRTGIPTFAREWRRVGIELSSSEEAMALLA